MSTAFPRLNASSEDRNPVMRSLKRAYTVSAPRAPGSSLLRHRAVLPPPPKDPLDVAADLPTCEMLTRFMAGQGIPSEDINTTAFQELLRFMDPVKTIPTQKQIELGAERVCNWNRPMVSFAKAVGPLSVTIDFVGDEDQKFMAFSIHFFEDFQQRKNVVYLRKMMLSKIDAESIMITIRRAVNNVSYCNVKFTNILTSDRRTSEILHRPDITKRHYVCFYYYVSQFVEQILKIPIFENGINKLREFVRHLKKHSDLYSKYRRMQLTKNAELDLPAVDKKDSWHSTAVFLTRCLILHDTFTEFSQRWNINNYIPATTFFELLQLQRVLQQCVTHCQQLSVETNSMSQVIPAIMSMRNYISSNSHGYPFEKQVRDAFTKTFNDLTNGMLSQRYDIATLLDPRHGYNDSIYSHGVWLSIERKLVEEFGMTYVQTSERNFRPETMDLSREERTRLLGEELRAYRGVCYMNRSEGGQSPFDWWQTHGHAFTNLTVLATEYLACPAVAIDAAHFFGPGGKLRYMCETMDPLKLEDFLVVAGLNQEYRGRGGKVDHVPPSVIARLNATAIRKRENERPFAVADPKKPKVFRVVYTEPVKVKEVKPELVDVKEEPIDEVTMNTPETLEKLEKHRRRCALCRMLEQADNVKNVTIDTEKLLLMLGAVMRKECNMLEARDVFNRPTKSYYCRVHFAEACDEIMFNLEVNSPKKIHCLPNEKFATMVRMAKEISGRSFELADVKILLIFFTEKYSESAFNQPELCSQPSDDDPDQVAPKSERLPRKQVLELVDQHDATIKLIQEEPFKLPQNPIAEFDSPPNPENQAMCCFCLLAKPRQSMLRMPKTEDRLSRWTARFGEQFVERLDPLADNFICREHFEKESFSSRGRLLKGMLPPESEKVEVTYRVQSDGFLKVDESKTGTDRAATVDLE